MALDDPQVLFVKDVPDAQDAQMDRNFFYRTVDTAGNPVDMPARLCGFSFFEEVGGLDPDADGPGIDLLSPDDPKPPAEYACRMKPYDVGSIQRYMLSYDRYLNALYDATLCGTPVPDFAGRINYVRLFLFDEAKTRNYPFVKGADGRYLLHKVDPNYMKRLTDFVTKARARGIVVCISLMAAQAVGSNLEYNTGWIAGPFYHRHNVNRLDDGTDGRATFCDIAMPPEYLQGHVLGLAECYDPPTYKGTWSPQEKRYFIQHQLFRKVVEATRGCWNVVYEIFNEGGSQVTGIVDWHVTVASWLDNCLRVGTKGPRARLISTAPTDEIVDALIAKAGGSIDFLSLHGSQWTTETTKSAPLCDPNYAIPADIGDTVGEAVKRFRGKGYAILFDADAAYRAQRLPAPYLNAVLGHDGSFNYRWPGKMLRQVHDPNVAPARGQDYCTVVNGNLGLDQRLALISAAANFKELVTRLPRPALPMKATLRTYFDAGKLHLVFDPPEAPQDGTPDTRPEGYVFYYGATDATVGQGDAEFFPAHEYHKVDNPGNLQLDIGVDAVLTAYPREVHIAVAAYNGLFVGGPSNTVQATIPSGMLSAQLVAAQLPFGSGAKVPTRAISGSLTFRNTGTALWKKQFPLPGGTVTTGIYMMSQDVYNESGRLFFPLPVDAVAVGQQVTFQLSNVVLPYWRRPQHFRIGMATLRVFDYVGYGHFDTVYDHLPNGAPAEVEVTNPKRRAAPQIDRAAVAVAAGTTYVDPKQLSVDAVNHTSDYNHHDVISCTTTATAPAGKVIRYGIEHRTLNSAASRAAVVSHDVAATVSVGLKVARLDIQDIDVPGFPDMQVAGFTLAPKSQQTFSLARFQNRYSDTAAASPTQVKAGQAVLWYEVLSASNPPVKQLRGQSTADVSVQLTTWTSEIWENVAAGQTDPRQQSGALTFAPGESVKYVRVSDAAHHHVHLAWLSTAGGAEVRHAFVLRANAQGVFERALEVTLGPHTQTVQVTYHVLDVFIDAIR